MVAYINDPFTRTVSPGFGTEPQSGLAYQHSATSTGLATDGAKATYAGTTSKLVWAGISQQDLDCYFDWSVTALPPAGETYMVAIVARVVDASNYYRADARVDSAGALALFVRSVVAGVATSIGAQVNTGRSVVGGDVIGMHARFSGLSPTTIAISAWNKSGAEPGTFDKSETDSTAGLQTSAAAGIRITAGTTAGLTWTGDNLIAQSIGGGVLLLGGL